MGFLPMFIFADSVCCSIYFIYCKPVLHVFPLSLNVFVKIIAWETNSEKTEWFKATISTRQSISQGPRRVLFFSLLFLLTFSTFPAGSEGGRTFPDNCFRNGSHLFEVTVEGVLRQ